MRDAHASQVQRVRVEPAPGVTITVLVPMDADAVLDAAVEDPGVDAFAHTLWPAGLAAAATLAGHLALRDRSLRDPALRVVDVGAGCGVVALTAAALGLPATALDHDRSALVRIADAAALQDLAVVTLRFDIAGDEVLPAADIAVFSDMLYEPALARSAARRVLEAHAAGMHVIVADPGRTGRAVFAGVLMERGFDVAFIDIPVNVPGDTVATVGVLQLPT